MPPDPAAPPPSAGRDLVYHDARNYLAWDGAAWRSEWFVGPPPRYLTGVAYDRLRQRLVLFGGGTTGDALLGDTWEFDGVTWARMP